MPMPNSLPKFSDTLENLLMQFDVVWNQPSIEQLQAAIPLDVDNAFLIELIRIDAQKRLSAGLTLDEAFYLQAFPALQEQPELMQKLRAITFMPMPVGDSVLRALAATTPMLNQVLLPSAERQETAAPFPQVSLTLPEHRYKLEGEIARGGMGAVLRGRDEDLGREIAVKVMLQNHAGKTELLQRFVEEAQIAGQLQHPGITPVYELGRFPDQRPYFTMKLVRGQTLAKLLKDRSDPRSERLRFLKIFEQICQTLAYAHSRKVIHRDLKPHNIMVGSFGEVQVMDWGLAKVLTGSEVVSAVSDHRSTITEAGEGSVQTKRSSGNSSDIPNTQAGSVLGTPAYMAPEQARGDIDQLDERADVFGLGAILCEILTGKPPYVGKDGMEIYRQAVDADLTDAYTRLQNCRADEDLITLAHRCLAANRDDRPRDASEFTKQLTGYLHSVEDRLRKAELTAVKAMTKAEEERKRQRITFQLAAGILLTLLVGLGASLWQMNRAMTAEEQAKENEGKALNAAAKEKTANELTAMRLEQIEKINNSVFDIFTEFDIRKVKSGLEPVEYVLTQRLVEMGKKLDANAIHDPLVLANLQDRLGRTLISLGRPEEAIVYLTSAREIRDAKLGNDQPDTLTSMDNLASSYQAVGKLDLALPLFEQTLKFRKAKLGPDHRDTLMSMGNLALGYQSAGKLDLALPLYEQTLKLRKATLGPDHPATLGSMHNLALGYQAIGKFDLALPLYEAALKQLKANFGPDHPDTLTGMGNLAFGYQAAGKLDLALPLFEQTLKLRKSKLGSDHSDTLGSMHNLAFGYQAAGKLDLALPLYEQTFKLMKAKFSHDHPDTLIVMGNLARCYQAADKLNLALPLFEETLKLITPKLGPTHPDTLHSMQNLAEGYLGARKFDVALALFEETLKLRKAKLGLDHPDTLATMCSLAVGYQSVGKIDLALPLHEDTFKFRKARLGPDHPATLMSMGNLAGGYWHAKQLDKSIPLFEETLKYQVAKLGRNHPNTLITMANLGVNYKDAGRLAESLPLLEEVYRSAKQYPTLGWVGVPLHEGYAKAGRMDAANDLMLEALTDARNALPTGSLQLAGKLALFGSSLLQAKAFDKAEPLLRESLGIRGKNDPDVWTTFNTQSLLGGALLGQKKFAEAEPLLLKGYEGMKQREAKIPAVGKPRLHEALDRLIQLYTETSKLDEVKKWQAEKDKLPKIKPTK